MILTLFLVSFSMAVRDILGTLLVIAEAKGRAAMAGLLDALGDGAQILCIAFGAGEIIVHGWDLNAVYILIVMCITSFITTTAATMYGRKWESVER